jgi:hypothetical protein
MLVTCWHKLDGLRTQYGRISSQTKEADLFASGWQVSSFLSSIGWHMLIVPFTAVHL